MLAALALVCCFGATAVQAQECQPKNKFRDCDKKERAYARKYMALDEAAQAKELARLRGLAGKSAKSEWMEQRTNILQHLTGDFPPPPDMGEGGEGGGMMGGGMGGMMGGAGGMMGGMGGMMGGGMGGGEEAGEDEL